ncbi:MAG: hypothetical protein A2W91_02135 [Bacteroidetes bacterium GWF2_38_335]|nr:MAG: hypothetical protein A2W91_02135 [Bacteroidetes bacterium GWF2_38_335]OFY80652.1 MAG: hypothetical protein A2281_05150 [Bacteroidetes bacterium RIFOXYA12_FULL_38_20]HBS86993.1 hypothetical protein [Bacteroidales bacterium]
MKTLLFIFAISFVCIVEAQSSLFVRQYSFPQTAYFLEDVSKISFSGSEMNVEKTGGEVDVYNLSDIRYLNFENLATENEAREEIESTDVRCYPNPVKETLNFEFADQENHKIEIIDFQGKLVYVVEMNGENAKVNFSGFPKGLYLCRISNGNNTVTKKVIKN